MPSVRQQSDVRPPDARRVAPIGGESSGARPLLRALDEQLFTPGPWLAIDAANVEVKGTRTATLDQALALIGQGRVTSVVGRLRPDVAGVDIDSPVFADEILNTLTAFCTSRGLWHLVRPSGGAPGRAHLLLIPGPHRDDLDDLVLRLRRELGRKADPVTGRRAAPLGRAHVDVRAQLRPLSAPHRCRPTPHLDHDVLTAALVDLDEVLAVSPTRHLPTGPTPGRDRSSTVNSSTANPSTAAASATSSRHGAHGRRTELRESGLHEAQTPLPRPRRAVPAGWAAYLEHGRTAAAAAGLDREPGSRSTIEYDATRALILAGLDEDAAWAAIATAHPTAFVKARTNGRRWWWHVWNAAVDKADDWLLHRRAELTQQTATTAASATEVETEVLAALAAAHAELEAQWRSWPAQVRHTRRELMLAVLERMARKKATAVELPQRDLLQDCALESRNTIAARRDDLIAADLLQVTSTHVRGTTDTADTWSLPVRFLTTQPSQGAPVDAARRDDQGDAKHRGQGVGCSEPTRGTPPQRPALPLRRSLGLPRAHLLEALLAAPTPQPPDQLASPAGLATGTPTPDQQRTLRGYLQALASLGLATVDAYGGWTASAAARGPLLISTADRDDLAAHQDLAHQDLVRLHRRGQDRQEAIVEAVTNERNEFRTRFDPEARRRRWAAQREQVLARQAKLDVVRRKAWWDGLPPAQQQQRRATAAAAFAALPLHQQAQRKHELAVRRVRTGLSERDRYLTWWDTLSTTERDERSVTKAATFHALPQDLRSEQVAAWTAHRARWNLPRPPARRGAGVEPRSAPQPLIQRSLVPV